MSDFRDYVCTAQILHRDIAGLEGEKLKKVLRMYMIQCISMLELKLESHGGLQTLRVRYAEHRKEINFVGSNW